MTAESQAKRLRNIKKFSSKRRSKELSHLQQAIYPHIVKGRDFVVETGPDTAHHVELLLPPLIRVRFDKPGIKALIITREPADITATAELLAVALDGKPAKRRSDQLDVVELGASNAARREASLIANTPHVIVGSTERVIDHIRRDNLDLSSVEVCVIDEPAAEFAGSFNADLHYIYSKFSGYPQTAVFTETQHDGIADVVPLLRRPSTIPVSTWRRDGTDTNGEVPAGDAANGGTRRSNSTRKESQTVSTRTFSDLMRDEKLKEQIDEIIRDIHDNEDPDEMNAFRKLIRKRVPFFRRGYFAAYLLKHYSAPSKSGKPSKPAKPAKQTDKNGDFSTVFVGVGKNRKVFPRDLIQLFTSVDGVTSDDIGQIKILDKYSFIELSKDKAQAAIDELSGKEYRGRKLNVNYARKVD
ncbi:MAG: DEAD/DEAH box helicase [Spirochaetes bacterium]|nr:DEAD/DEAH box helicase [Spirochaetota bacterium]